MSHPSSPVLKARRQTHNLYSKMLYSILCVCFTIWLVRSVILRLGQSSRILDQGRKGDSVDDGLRMLDEGFLGRVPRADTKRIGEFNHSITSQNSLSLTIILPVTSASIASLESNLHSLLRPSRALVEVVLTSPRQYHPQIRKALRTMLSRTDDLDLEFSVAQWAEGTGEGAAVIMAAQHAMTDWVLLADADGFKGLDATTRDFLLLNSPPRMPVPIGSRGVISNMNGSACLTPSSLPQQASYLVPPLVLPTSLLPDTLDTTYAREPWIALGKHISRLTSGPSGGTVLGSSDSSPAWCLQHRHERDSPQVLPATAAITESSQYVIQGGGPAIDPGFFLLVVNGSDVPHIAFMACNNARQGHRVSVIALLDGDGAAKKGPLTMEGCSSLVAVHRMSSWTQERADGELRQLLPQDLDVLISAVDEDAMSSFLEFYSQVRPAAVAPVDIRIPREDLPYCDWMAAVELSGWKNWHTPRIELSVITDTRPHSLRRLLSSLTSARYFGDALNLRINVERTADEETLQLVGEYEWTHGETFLHHRIVHGGLMTAVVESWYPKDNDSYGLILEDDVELSPLFYAWIKMSLLRYRYGRPEERNPNLFGISLYQQKNLELRPEGRHLFDARATFTSAGVSHLNTPYLSQIPCSWGALYFPEQWREFHTYLVTRLDSAALPLSEPVVPEVRSNRWTRSWKKYFIELVYLRGYVMLYPNYAEFASLSTNHLEAGSHVKDMPAEAHARKKKLFTVPLMSLPPASSSGETRTGLLELPDARLPGWDDLPVLDLLGTIVDEETLARRGRERRTNLTGCDGMPTHANDVHELLCTH